LRETIEILILILVANGSPVLMSFLLSHRMSLPIDLGLKLKDQQYLFGKTKTWRGLVTSLVATVLASFFITGGFRAGLVIVSLAMSGDLLSSFIKRRLKKESSSKALLLDQIPESLFPALGMMLIIKLDLIQVIEIVIAFIIIELMLSQALYRIGIRKYPY
jgi:CDP-diglyceride synthetase